MKTLIKKAIAKSVRNETIWNALNATLLRLTHFMERQRFWNENAPPPPNLDLDEALKAISPDLTVRNGIFRGLKYPSGKSVGSMLIPKLLGSYERELQPLMERLLARQYSEIVDIGCAEGYYAVGLAMRLPTALVYAYDTNEEAVRLCRKMAEINHVSERLIMGSFCDARTLQALPLTTRALVISDCEGYENKLFNEETLQLLARHDLLIEIHDHIDITTSSYIRSICEKTHRIEVIESIDDLKKARQYDYKELESYSLAERMVLLREWRSSIMEWFYLTPRSEPGNAPSKEAVPSRL